MKVRLGFVSNSSSSSFCILGVRFDNEDVAPKLEQGKLSCEYAISEGDHDFYLGLNPTEMKDDETLLRFKQRILDEFVKDGHVFKLEDLRWYEDSGYNG